MAYEAPMPLHVFSSVSSAGIYALRFCLIKAAVVFGSASSYGVGNRAAFSDSRSNFHTRVGYRTNVCRRRLASDLARASEGTPAQGAHEDHHDRLPGSPRHRSESMRRERLLSCCHAQASTYGGYLQSGCCAASSGTNCGSSRTDQHGGCASADCGRRSRTKSAGHPAVEWSASPQTSPSVRIRSGADLYGSANGSGGSRSGAWQSPHLRDQRSSRSNGAVEVSCVRHLAVPRRRTSSACLL